MYRAAERGLVNGARIKQILGVSQEDADTGNATFVVYH